MSKTPSRAMKAVASISLIALAVSLLPLQGSVSGLHAADSDHHDQPCLRAITKGPPLRYYESLRSASVEHQATQLECMLSYASRGNPRAKLMLALTLLLPDAPFTDTNQAAKLLEAYLTSAEPNDAQNRSLAVLLLTLLKRIATLEEQLDRLKEIERDITETEQSVNIPTPAPESEVSNEPEEDDTSSR